MCASKSRYDKEEIVKVEVLEIIMLYSFRNAETATVYNF